MYLIPVPAAPGNCLRVLHHSVRALVVKLGEAEPVMRTLAPYGPQLESILVTHHNDLSAAHSLWENKLK